MNMTNPRKASMEVMRAAGAVDGDASGMREIYRGRRPDVESEGK
jgi:hypothetical protein